MSAEGPPLTIRCPPPSTQCSMARRCPLDKLSLSILTSIIISSEPSDKPFSGISCDAPKRLLRPESTDMHACQVGWRRVGTGDHGIKLILRAEVDQARFARCSHDIFIVEQLDANLIGPGARLDVQQRRFRRAAWQVNRSTEGVAHHSARCLGADHQPSRHRLAVVLQFNANGRPLFGAEERIETDLDRHFDDIAEIVLRRRRQPSRQRAGKW